MGIAKLIDHEVFILIAEVVALLGLAKLLGEISKKIKQPAVLGEILAGIILGPTILGNLFPNLFQWLFIETKNSSLALDGLVQFSTLMLLFVVGLEIELKQIIKQGKTVAWLTLTGVGVPFVLGTAVGWCSYSLFPMNISQTVFALFVGAAMSISALPVIAKVLLDLNLLKTKIGGLIIAVAATNDIIGWILFTVVLGLSGLSGGENNIIITIVATLALAGLSVTLFKKFMDWLLDMTYNFTHSSGAVIGVCMIFMFLGAMLTQWIGIHAVFGPFLVGMAVSSSRHFTHQMKEHFMVIVSNVLAPLFFASVGLKVNFFASFDLIAVSIIIATAYVTKMSAAWIGGRISRLTHNEIMAVGLGITARGGMGIILAVISFNAGLITAPIFAALVIMAVVTSMTSGLITKFSKVESVNDTELSKKVELREITC